MQTIIFFFIAKISPLKKRKKKLRKPINPQVTDFLTLNDFFLSDTDLKASIKIKKKKTVLL